MKSPIRVLLVENERIDQMAFGRLVSENNLPYETTIASSASEAAQRIQDQSIDIALIDYRLNDGTAFDLFNELQPTPIIVITGAGDEHIAVEALKRGAYDYIIKDLNRDYLKVLPEVIKQALQRHQVDEQLRMYQENLEMMVAQRTEQLHQEKELLSVTLAALKDGVIAVNTQGRIKVFNRAAEEMTGYTQEEAFGRPIREILQMKCEKDHRLVTNPLERTLQSGEIEDGQDFELVLERGHANIHVSVISAPIYKDDQRLVGAVMVLQEQAKVSVDS